MTQKLVLYCKSYCTDFFRTLRLAKSIDTHNANHIPFVVSVPERDLALFRDALADHSATVICDDEIIKANSALNLDEIRRLPGNKSQQIVKSEFWRLGYSDAYACIDSDAFFIAPFYLTDFVAPSGDVYTVIDEAHDILDLSLRTRNWHVIENFQHAANTFKNCFERVGPNYSFGPNPYIWHNDVWRSLEREWLLPRSMTFKDAIDLNPLEANWYGEALLRFKAIPVMPRQSFFKVYHYAWQLDLDRRQGIDEEVLKRLYRGVIHQSAWDRALDWPREPGSTASKFARRLRRLVGRT